MKRRRRLDELGVARVLGARPDEPVLDPARLEQPLPGERRGVAEVEDLSQPRRRPFRPAGSATAAATRIASSASASWRRNSSAPAAAASAVAASVAAPAALGRLAALPRAGEHGAEEVLARDRHEQGPPQRAQLAEPAQELEVVLGRQVEVRPRVEDDLPLVDAGRERGVDPLREPALQVLDDVVVARRGAVDPRRPLDVHQDVPAAALRHEAEHLRVEAAGDVVDRRRPGVERRRGDLDRERVGEHRHAGLAPRAARSPAPGARSRPRAQPAGRCAPPPRRRRAGRTRPRRARARRRPRAPACRCGRRRRTSRR